MRKFNLAVVATGIVAAMSGVGAGSYLYGVRSTQAEVDERHPLILDPSCVEIVGGKPRVIPDGKVEISYRSSLFGERRSTSLLIAGEPGNAFNTPLNETNDHPRRRSIFKDARYTYGNKLSADFDVASPIYATNLSIRIPDATGYFYVQTTNEALIADLVTHIGKGAPPTYGVSKGGKVYVIRPASPAMGDEIVTCDLDENGMDVRRLAPARLANTPVQRKVR